MRKMLLALCLVLGALLAVSVVAAQDDEGGVTIPLLADGETVDAEFEDSSMQIFMFLGSEGDEVTITMESDDPSVLDPFVILLGTTGEVIAYNDDVDYDNGDYNSEIDSVELPADGRYIVLASTYNEFQVPSVTPDSPLDEPLAYTLTASGFNEPQEIQPEESNNFVLEAEDGEVHVEGTLTVSADLPVAYIFFPAEEGQEISLSTSEVSDSDQAVTDTLIYVFDAEGQRIAGNDDIDLDNGDYFSEVSVEAPDSGTYIAFVTSYAFWAAAEDPDNYAGAGDIGITLDVQ
ncbi:MAG: hypothetical protein U0694_03095 [Anaerolineae bacterium]